MCLPEHTWTNMMDISYGDAVAQLADPHACFKQITNTRHFGLLPRYLGNISLGIKEQLSSELKKYCDSLKGVPVSYNKKSIKCLGNSGMIFDEDPAIHLKLQVEFIIFQPTVGCTLKGTVNKVAKNHIGCLVHGCFNASVSRPQSTVNGWDGSLLELGQEFLFQVTSIESENGVLFMRGKLEKEIAPPVKRGMKRSVSDMLETSVCDSPKEANDDSVKKKKKRRKKDKDGVGDNSQTELDSSQKSVGDSSNPLGSLSYTDAGDSFISAGDPGEGQSDSSITKKKKKKKHKKEKNEETSSDCFTKLRDVSLDSSLTPPEDSVPGSNGTSGKKHKSKKEKKLKPEISSFPMGSNSVMKVDLENAVSPSATHSSGTKHKHKKHKKAKD